MAKALVDHEGATTSPRDASAQGPPPGKGLGHRSVEPVWAHRFAPVAAAVVLAGAYGVLAGLWTPRGPVTASEALAAMVLGAGVGFGTGALLRSRWAMLLAPVVFVTTFELIRLDATGPTVDAPTASMLSSQLGVVAAVTGRVFHAILALWPMLVGVAFGRIWATRRTRWLEQGPSAARGRAGSGLGRVVLTVSSAVLLVLAVALMRPAHTDPIRGADGEPIPGSIAELTTVEIGGHEQSLLIRGHDRDDPVMLFLAGGPGGSETGTMSARAGHLERDFVVVTWDQLGTGRSTGQFDPAETLSVEGAVADTVEVTEHLRARFGVQQVYLVGNSYGTLIGTMAAQQRPELYAALVGTGQMVDPVETDRLFYEDALGHAEATGDAALAATLRDNGPPPYEDLLKMSPLVASERVWNDYSDIYGFPGLQEPTEHLLVTEYSLMETVRSMSGLLDTYSTMYPELYAIDLRADVAELDVPVYVVQGAHEARGRLEPAREWFDLLDAPHKEWIVFERSGHRPWVQEPERFAEVMTGTVLADVDPDADVDGTPATPAAGADELRHLFTDYNQAVWPLHVLAYVLGIGAVGLVLLRPGPTTDRFVVATLAAVWAWLGIVFFGRFAAQLDPLLSAAYGALFVFQAVLFVRAGIVRHELRFRPSNGLSGRIGWTALAYALVVYPLLGVVLGHSYPEAPLFGMAPCPTTVATFGLLLLVVPDLSKRLLVIPTIWAVLAPLAAVGHGYPEDLGLFAAGIAVWVAVGLRRNHSTGDPDEAIVRTGRTSEKASR